jgi:hypothetical protein
VAVNEQHELVRKRIFSCRSLDDIPAILEKLKQEKFMGALTVNIGAGGTPSDVKVEERAKVQP